MYLVQSLPGISRWFEVEKREVVRKSLTLSYLSSQLLAQRHALYYRPVLLMQTP